MRTKGLIERLEIRPFNGNKRELRSLDDVFNQFSHQVHPEHWASDEPGYENTKPRESFEAELEKRETRLFILKESNLVDLPEEFKHLSGRDILGREVERANVYVTFITKSGKTWRLRDHQQIYNDPNRPKPVVRDRKALREKRILEPEESARDAAIRAIFEETGGRLKPPRFLRAGVETKGFGASGNYKGLLTLEKSSIFKAEYEEEQDGDLLQGAQDLEKEVEQLAASHPNIKPGLYPKGARGYVEVHNDKVCFLVWEKVEPQSQEGSANGNGRRNTHPL